MPSLFCAIGSETASLQDHEIRGHVNTFLDALGPVDEVCLVPPDFTRFHSQAGKITQMITEYYYGSTTNHAKTDAAATAAIPKIQIMPALGTHTPMTKEQIQIMFGEDLASKTPSPFLVHDWRNDVETIGYAPAEMVK